MMGKLSLEGELEWVKSLRGYYDIVAFDAIWRQESGLLVTGQVKYEAGDSYLVFLSQITSEGESAQTTIF